MSIKENGMETSFLLSSNEAQFLFVATPQNLILNINDPVRFLVLSMVYFTSKINVDFTVLYNFIMIFYCNLYVKLFLILASTFFYCEFLIYYLVIYQCSWPELQDDHEKSTTNALFLTDPHLLGPYRGHWFDKLRREWQIYRSFQSALSIHLPDTVFILGDLFDEGQWCDKYEFEKYISRFFSLFKVPQNTNLYVVPGNHDIGFHYKIRIDLTNKFEKVFNTSSVQFLNLKDSYFILINSMAMEGDGCYLCDTAEKKLKRIARKLRCIKNGNCKSKEPRKKGDSVSKYSRPIILQHFPMYRKSDSKCNEIDEAPPEIKNKLFIEKWDCLSKEASEMIYNDLNPRAIFTGHVHHGCHTLHRTDIHEYTLPSFSWRNKINPTFTLGKITPNKYAIQKCELPKESTVIFIYVCVGLGIIIWGLYSVKRQKIHKKIL